MTRTTLTVPMRSSLRSKILTSAVAIAVQFVTPTLLATAPVGAAAQAAARQEYILGSGDVVRINVYQSPDLSIETRINETGTISYPLLGTVRLGGLSVGQAERAISDGLRSGNFLKSPQVNVLVMQVRSAQVNALGMVGKPGRYPLEIAGLRVSDVLAMAGGINVGGADIVTLTGTRNGQPFRRQIDVPNLLTSGNAADDAVVQNGDTIFADRMPQVYIYGEVQRPGVIRLERNMTVMQALAAGGGLTQRGTDKGLKVHRPNSGRVEILEPGLTDIIRDGDVIHVRQSLF